MRVSRVWLLLLCGTGFLFAEHFIVKKTKQIIAAYTDQWCDQFGQFLQLCADFDAQRSVMQKQGVKDILNACESGQEVELGQWAKEDQQCAVQKLRALNELLQKTTRACEEYVQLMKKNAPIAKKT